MDGINVVIGAALADVSTEALALAPAAIGVTALFWGVPKIVSFFKRVAK
jgi:hypothetical protein